MIDVTNVDLKEFIKEAYNLSKPVGLGFLHFQPGDLEDADVEKILNKQSVNKDGECLSMDYINGRSCKMHIFNKDGHLFIHDNWYDHTENQLKELLQKFGLQEAVKEEVEA